MAKQAINIGTLANDGTGDTLRAALDKCNDNFDELYALTDGTGAASVLTLAAGTATLGDTTISDATPVLIFKDSSCSDSDNNATITVNATATGSGAENIDVILASQVAGVATTFLNADADGSITLGDATRGIVLSGAVTSGDIIISDATPQLSLKDSSCAVADVNALIKADATDTGDGTEDIDVTFQQQVAGLATTFLVSDADGSLTLGQTNQAIVLNGPVADITMKDSSPVLKIIDSDAVDGDAGVSLTVTCTTTTAGAEHVDATFTQQVGGSPVNFLVADADGSITLGDGTRAISLNGTVGDVTIKDATPTLEFKDSSCTDNDVNFDIVAAATDTGTGAEDIDVTFGAQVAGTKVTFLNFDADGSLSLGYGGQPVWVAKLQSAYTVTPNTGTATPASTDSGTVYNNIGDSDGSTITLPTAAAGLQFTVCVMVNQIITVTAGTGDLIRIAANVTAAAGSITSSTVGSSVTLVAQDNETWLATAYTGNWAFP